MRLILATLATLVCATPLFAQSVSDCDWRARADAIPEPWEDYSRAFANGAVRVALLDGIEPAAAAFHLLILHPPYMELGERQCHIVSFDDRIGYAALYFTELEAGYDPARGLTVDMPGMLYLPDDGFSNSLRLFVTINQATGEITASHELGPE